MEIGRVVFLLLCLVVSLSLGLLSLWLSFLSMWCLRLSFVTVLSLIAFLS